MKPSTILKSIVFSAVTAAGLASMPAFATPYNLDTLLGSQNLGNSGDATELAALKTYVPSYTGTLTKTNSSDVGFNVMQNPGTTDEWFIDVGTATPGYFLLKFGTGGTTVSDDTYFFQNLAELRYLVFSDAQVQFLSGGACANNPDACNIGRLSHYSITSDTGGDGGGGGNGGEIPEPATLALMGLGLAGMLARRRRGA